MVEKKADQVKENYPAIQFNTMIARYDTKSRLFLVEYGNSIIPLNLIISLLIEFNGKFTPLGMSYNPDVGYQCQELAFMYRVTNNSGFEPALQTIIRSSNESRENKTKQSNRTDEK